MAKLVLAITIFILTNTAFGADVAKMYACYKSLAVPVNEALLFDNRTAGVEALTDTTFVLLSSRALQTCTLSKKSNIVKIQSGGKPILINYKVGKLSGAPTTKANLEAAKTPVCEQLPSSEWIKFIEKRINNFRQECDDPDARGMSTAPKCLADFIDALKPCAKVPEWTTIMSEYKRSAQAAQRQRIEAGQPTEVRAEDGTISK